MGPHSNYDPAVPEDQITEADIERMKRGFELYNARDYQALREFVAPDVVIERVGGLPPVHGFEALVALQEPDAFEWQHLHAVDWTINGDRGLVRVRIHAKGAGSGVELDVEGWQVYTLRDGLVVRMQNFLEEADARAAAGL
jgi:ketosteroid isomerase-like protein